MLDALSLHDALPTSLSMGSVNCCMDLRNGRTVRNLSTTAATWTGSTSTSMRIDNGSTFENAGTINMTGDADVSYYNCCTGIWDNTVTGGLRKTAPGTGDAISDIQFVNLNRKGGRE